MFWEVKDVLLNFYTLAKNWVYTSFFEKKKFESILILKLGSTLLGISLSNIFNQFDISNKFMQLYGTCE